MTPRQAEALRLFRETGSKAETARRMGMDPGNLYKMLNAALAAEGATPEDKPEPTRMEVRDAAFWRTLAKGLEKEVADLEHLFREVQGLASRPVQPPRWITEAAQGSRSIVIAHTSDVHMGERVHPTEIGGTNTYDPDICRERMRRYFNAACTIPFRWLHDSKCDGVLLTMGGDLTSGDIHAELSATNALTGHEQLAAVVEVYIAGIRQLLEHFAAVHVVVVPGNHGRTTHKPQAKRSGSMSYDTLAGAMVRAAFSGDARVTFQIADGPDCYTPVYGRGIVTTHGDRMGTGGGMGFAGPVLPIVRGGHKVREQYRAMGKNCDLILSGHFHFSAAPPGMLANGSVVGTSEYGYGLRFAPDGPKQWLARYSMAWGLCERLEVQLEPRAGRMRERAA